MSETFSYPDLRFEAVIALQSSAVSVGHRHIPVLHADQFPVSLEIVIGREHSRPDQFFLERGDIVQKVLRLTAADVIYRVRRNRQAVFSVLLFRYEVLLTQHA